MRPSRQVAWSLLIIIILCFFAISVGLAQGEATEVPQPESTEALAVIQPEVTAAVLSGQTTYTVVRGDTLFSIARRFNTTTSALAAANGIANPSLIFAGQVLTIPSGAAPTPVSPTATPPAPSQNTGYVVQRGDTLYRIAVRNGTTVAELARINNIANPNIIFAGQRLTISAPQPAGTAPTVSTGQPASTTTALAPMTNPGFAYGIEAFFFGQDANTLTTEITQLGMSWTKVRVDWRELESVENQIEFTELDNIVATLDAAGLNILFTITNAPTWARTSVDENGPPDDLADFARFVSTIALRYASQVDAYEIWDEPNLRRNWRCDQNNSPAMCSTDYVQMLRLAYDAIKAANPTAIVVSAGLSPTGFNDGINAINDKVYLQTLYANGLAEISDAVGAHPGGWANPPDARCCEQPIGVETHYQDASFYFVENLGAYREIMVAAGDSGTALWVTKFGWGTSEDTDPPSDINIFVTYTSIAEQALYVPAAYTLGSELGFIGPMFLDNLNGCQGLSSRAEACYVALISPTGAPRLVFNSVQSIDKSTASVGETSPETLGTVPEATVEPLPPAGASDTQDTAPLPPDENVLAPEETQSP